MESFDLAEAVAAAVVVAVAVDDEAAAEAQGRHVVVAVVAEEAMLGHNSEPAYVAEAHIEYVAASGEVPDPPRVWRVAAAGDH